MKVVIATPLYPPDIGGPATYSKALEDEFPKHGVSVAIVKFGDVRHLPKGLSHIVYFFHLLRSARTGDAIWALDPISVGLSAVIVGKLMRIPVYARIGGDTLWERYIERTHDTTPLSLFYDTKLRTLTAKERLFYSLVRYFVNNVRVACFSTEWQMKIWQNAYQLSTDRTRVVPNEFPAIHIESQTGNKKTFLWAGRDIHLKNLPKLRRAFERAKEHHPEIALETASRISHDELIRKIKDSYALVLPSLTDISPNFILEGLAVGKPFVMTRETGIRNETEHFGLFVDPNDEQGISDAIAMLADPLVYQKFQAQMHTRKVGRTISDIAKDLMSVMGNTL